MILYYIAIIFPTRCVPHKHKSCDFKKSHKDFSAQCVASPSPQNLASMYIDAPRPSVCLGGFGIYILRIVYAYHH